MWEREWWKKGVWALLSREEGHQHPERGASPCAIILLAEEILKGCHTPPHMCTYKIASTHFWLFYLLIEQIYRSLRASNLEQASFGSESSMLHFPFFCSSYGRILMLEGCRHAYRVKAEMSCSLELGTVGSSAATCQGQLLCVWVVCYLPVPCTSRACDQATAWGLAPGESLSFLLDFPKHLLWFVLMDFILSVTQFF